MSTSALLNTLQQWLNPYIQTFKAYPTWKQALISSGVIIGTPIVYTLFSYNISKLLYGKSPTIPYKIHGDINNNDGILVFIHGWPDINELWQPQTRFFSTDRKYCCITLELPNFHIDKIQNPWGYEIPAVVNALGNTLQQILSQHNQMKAQVVLIGHDWGSFMAQLLYLQFKEVLKFKQLVMLDVGDGKDPADQQEADLYPLIHAGAFLLPSFIGTWYLRRYWRRRIEWDPLFKGSKLKFPIWRLEEQRNRTYFHSGSAYLYFYMVKSVMSGNKAVLRQLMLSRRLHEFEGVARMFVDARKGREKGYRAFYTSKFEKTIKEREDCKWVELDCYHWVQDEQTGLPEKLNECLLEFIQK